MFVDLIKGVQADVMQNLREKELVVVYPVDDHWTPREVPGIFDDAATFLLVGDDVTYSSSNPLLGLLDRDHQGKRGDEIEVRCKRYRAVDVRPDGHGFSVLVLEAI